MDFRLTSDQLGLQQATSEVCARFGPPDPDADAPAMGRTWWRALDDLDVFSLLVPDAQQGMGLGAVETALVLEQLGRFLAPGPVAETVVSAEHLVGHLVGQPPAGGTDTGTVVVTLLPSGPAPLVVENLDVADLVAVDRDDVLSFVRPGRVPVLRIAAPLDPRNPVTAVGTPDLEAPVLVLDGAARLRWLRYYAVAVAAQQVGISRAVLEQSVTYVGQRQQFGRPVGGFQSVKHLAADMLVRSEVAWSAVLVAAATLDGETTSEPGAERAVAVAKMLADRAATRNARDAHQLHGGMGYAWETGLHLYLKRSWALATTPRPTEGYVARLVES